MPATYYTYGGTGWATVGWSTTSNTYSNIHVDTNMYGAWNINEVKKDKIDECKIEDDELLDLIRDDS